MDDVLKNRELVSALADGQLRGDEFARTVRAAASDEDAQAAWHAYHLVGDVLRSAELASGASDAAFMARLRAGLEQQPVQAVAADSSQAMAPAIARQLRAPAANESSFRWKLVAGCASLAAVTAIGWSAVGGFGGNAGLQPQLAQAPVNGPQAPAPQQAQVQAQQQVTIAGTQQVMIRDPRLDELLSAHRQFGGTSALQMPAGFLRNATFEGPAR